MSWPKFYKDLCDQLPLTPDQRFTFLNRCSYPQGPSNGQIAFVGEAPGANEEKFRDVFSGAAGRELHRMMAEASIDPGECLFTNVFMERPLANDWSQFFVPEKSDGAWLNLPSINKKRLAKANAWHIERLRREIEHFKPNIVVALGNIPVWALCARWGISKIRGTVTKSTLTGSKLMPTFHPAYILRNWEDRVLVIADLLKAERESHYAEIQYPARDIWIEPSIQDLWDFHDQYIKGCTHLAFDIETTTMHDGSVTIACISLAPSPQHSLVIPFTKNRSSYWPTTQEEVEALFFLHQVLGEETPWKKVAQNGIFDIQYLWQEFRLQVRGYSCDTMFLHHAWQPEMSKGLDFLSAAFTNERAWKWLRPKGKRETKKDE